MRISRLNSTEPLRTRDFCQTELSWAPCKKPGLILRSPWWLCRWHLYSFANLIGRCLYLIQRLFVIEVSLSLKDRCHHVTSDSEQWTTNCTVSDISSGRRYLRTRGLWQESTVDTKPLKCRKNPPINPTVFRSSNEGLQKVYGSN